jgi:hypothetical protein
VLIGANPCLKEYDLKKQSQFAGGHIGLNSDLKGSYGYIAANRTRKNKPNSKPNKACPFGKLRAGSERSRTGQFAGSLYSVIFLDNIVWPGIIFADNKDIPLYGGRL